MSDHDNTPDPVDKAYVEAEAMLSDDAARAARRAQVLAAVAREPVAEPMMATAASPAAASSATPTRVRPATPRWRPMWRRDGLLAAACVAGLGILLANRFYQPITVAKPPAIHAVPNPAGPRPATAPPPTQAASQDAAASAPHRSKPLVSPPPRPVAQSPATTKGLAASAPQAFPATAGKASNTVNEVVVTGSRIAHPAYTSASPITIDPARDADITDKAAVGGVVAPTYLAPPAPPPPPPPDATYGALDLGYDAATSLGVAATAGRVDEVEALLAKGAPVDATDAKGDTALMKSIRADHPAVAALLRRHGASLDRKNKAGKTARDMAKAIDDEALNRALGIEP